MSDKAAEDRLNALCSGVDLLSQLVANGEENDPKLRGQLLQLTSAIAKFEHSVRESKVSCEHHGNKEASAKLFKSVLPTPKGKLVLIIERLIRASRNQRSIERSTSVDSTVCSRKTDAVDEVCYHKTVETGWADKKSKSIEQLGSREESLTDCAETYPPQSSSSSQPNQVVQPLQAASVSMPSLQTSLAASASQTSVPSHCSTVSQHSLLPSQASITTSTCTIKITSLLESSAPSTFSSKAVSSTEPSTSRAVPPPPPPPALPSLEATVTHYRPSVPLKPLFWRRVQFSSAQLRTVDNVWKHISEPALGDVEKFVKSFSRKDTTPHTLRLSLDKPRRNSAIRPITILDGKRSQAIGIMLGSLPCGTSELGEAVRSGGVTLVDRETLQAIHDLQATVEELSAIRTHLKSPHPLPLDAPEMFMYALSEVPQFSERLLCVLYSQTLPETSAAILDKLSMLSRVCQQLNRSKEVNTILGLVLALGNLMNTGNKVRGQADGFHLEILPKLRDVKTADNSSNLLKFLVSCYRREREKSAFAPEFPLPDPADLMTSAQLDFDLMRSCVSEYISKVDSFRAALREVLVSSPSDGLEPFKSRMEGHMKQVESKGGELSSLVNTCEQQFHSLVDYFCVAPPSGQSSVNPGYFFGLWSSFVVQFNEYWKQEKKNLARERVRAEELKRRNGTLVRPVASSGLKSRLKTKRCYSSGQ